VIQIVKSKMSMGKINYKFLIVSILLLSSLFILSTPVSAQGTYSCTFDNGICKVAEDGDNCEGGFSTRCRGNTVAECVVSGVPCIGLADRVNNFYKWSLGIGVVVALGIIVYGGLVYTTSGGNESRMRDAKKWIWAALLGLLILFSSVIVFNLINPNLRNLTDPLVTENPDVDYVDPGWQEPPVDQWAVPEGGLDLNSLPKNGSGQCEAVLCGNNNPCVDGNYLPIDGTRSDDNLSGGPVGENVSYVIIAGDIEKVILYEHEQYNTVGPEPWREIVIDKDGDIAKCSIVHNGGGIEDCSYSLVSLISGDVIGLDLNRGEIDFNDAPSSIKVFCGTGGDASGGINPLSSGLLPGGVADSDGSDGQPTPDFSRLRNGSGEGFVYLCGNDNPCEDGNYLGITVIGDQVRSVSNMDNLTISTSPHVGEDQVSYIILGGDVKRVVFYVNRNSESYSFEISKGRTPSGGVVYSCITAQDQNPPYFNDCSDHLVSIGGDRNNIIGINLTESAICVVDADHNDSCSLHWDDLISSVEVYGGVSSGP
jgi:hypothetical protein